MKKKIIIVIIVIVSFAFICTGLTLLLVNNDKTKEPVIKKKPANVEDNVEVVTEPVNTEDTNNTSTVYYDFPKNDDATDTNSFKKNSDGTLSNTSEKLFNTHTIEGIEISELKIQTKKDDPEMAELKAKVTNKSNSPLGDTGFFLIFEFADGTKSHPFSFNVNSIPVGETVEVSTTCIDRVIDASDYTFTIKRFGGGAG